MGLIFQYFQFKTEKIMTNRREFIKKFLIGGSAVLVTPRLLSAHTITEIVNHNLRPYPAADDAWAQVPLILKRIKPPVFPKRDFSITRYGAVGDGQKDCTEAFKKAINACNKAGGGRVVVSEGTFLTGAIHLKSNVNLYVSKGATIKKRSLRNNHAASASFVARIDGFLKS